MRCLCERLPWDQTSARVPTTSARKTKRPASAGRAIWLKQLYQWHWISSAISLIGLLLFTATGVTLNHAELITTRPTVVEHSLISPPNVRRSIAAGPTEGDAPLPAAVRHWLDSSLSIDTPRANAEWAEDGVYLAMPRPGGDAWVHFDRTSGMVEYEKTTRGVISLLNDLHKGRNTGPVWRGFIDVFAAACFVFSLTGLVLLHMHARRRAATWPLVAAGLAAPAILILLFIHL